MSQDYLRFGLSFGKNRKKIFWRLTSVCDVSLLAEIGMSLIITFMSKKSCTNLRHDQVIGILSIFSKFLCLI
jgi:hypothetical protein